MVLMRVCLTCGWVQRGRKTWRWRWHRLLHFIQTG